MNTKNYFRTIISALFILLILTNFSFAQSAGDYRSVATGNWSDLSIWQRYDGVSWLNVGASPTSSDGVITIQSPNVVSVDISVTADQLVVNSGATLNNVSSFTIADGVGTDLDVNGTFNLNGTLSGAGTIQINSGGSFNWIGGYFDLTGTINVNTGSAMMLSSGNNKFFYNSGTINNYATCDWTGTGGLYMYYGAPSFNNYGTFNINTDAGIYNYYVGTSTFTNEAGGVLNKIGGTGETQFQSNCTYNNYGTIAVSSGTLSLLGTGTDNGIVNNTSAGTLNFPSGICHVNTGATFIGAGNVTITGGVFSVDGAASAGGSCVFNWSSGNMSGASVFNFNSGSTFNWQGGYFDVSGTINVNAGSAMMLSSGNNKFFYNSGTINNYATCDWTGTGGLYMYYGAPSFNNYGTFNINTDANINNYYVGTSTFTNEAGGVLNKIGGTGETQFQSNCTYNNYGTIAISSGTLSLMGTGTDNGIVNNTSAGTLNFPSGICHVNTGATFIGAGNVTITGGVFSIDGAASAGGACVFNWSSGNMSGASVFNFNSGSTFNWQGGYFDVSGTINVNAGSAMMLSSGNNKFFYNSGTINNYATCDWTGTGGLYMYYGAPAFNNYGTFNINTDAGINNYYVGTSTFTNEAGGVLNKIGGTGETQFQSNCTYNNYGTIAISSGTLSLMGTGTDNGIVNNTSAGTLNFPSGICHVNTGATFIGAGNVNITGGVFSVDGAASAGGACVFNWSSGNMSGASVFNFNSGSTFNWQGGYFDVSGTINVNAGSAMMLSSGNNKFFYNSGTINNYATCDWTGTGGLYMYYGAPSFNNYGTFNINTDAGIYNYYVGTSTFTNETTGTMNRTGGAGTTTFQSSCTFNNAGTTNINAGTFSFITSPNPHSGIYSIASGAILYSPLAVSYTGSSFTNNGSVQMGSLDFNGSANQLLAGTGNINVLSFNAANGATLGGTQTINYSLSLNNGLVTMGNNNLIVAPTASLTGGGSSSYFVTSGTGGLKRRVNNNTTNVLFPIGTATSYLPANVQLTGGSATDDFTARVINQLNYQYDNSDNGYGTLVTSNTVGKTWVIKEDVIGGSNATVTLQWNGADELVSFNRSNADIFNFDGTNWQHNTFGASTGSDPYTITRSGITSFKEFAVSDDISILNTTFSCLYNYYTLCQGGTISIPYSASGSFAGGNVFTAELSDATGSFASPVVIGTVSATTSGTITGVILAVTPAGTNYNIRVTSSNPSLISGTNGSPITVTASQATVFYQDLDGDGYGNPAVTITSCSTPAGYVPDNTDCDDNNNTIHTFPTVGYTVSPSATVCAGTSVTLNGTGATTYVWTGGVTDATAFTPSATATYTVTGTLGTNSCSGTAVATVTVNALPTVAASGAPTTICSGVSASLSATGATTYNWMPGNLSGASVSATPLTTTTFTVTGTDGNGCANTSTQIINVNTSPTVGSSITPSNIICNGTSVTLTGTGANSYSWTGGISNGVAFTPTTNSGPTGISTTNSSMFVGLRKLVSNYNGF